MIIHSSDNETVSAAERMANTLRAYGSRANTRLEKAILKGCLTVERDAKKNLTANKSVITGYLRASITHQLLKDEAGNPYGLVGTNTHYAPYVEYGTLTGNRPRPYLRPALEANIEQIKADIAEATKLQ